MLLSLFSLQFFFFFRLQFFIQHSLFFAIKFFFIIFILLVINTFFLYLNLLFIPFLNFPIFCIFILKILILFFFIIKHQHVAVYMYEHVCCLFDYCEINLKTIGGLTL
ncbi:unnamed protein product [Meloidogyne enterolobii]|uniref:Uncharacterized protein n=1 Tax=Meloidogyne enterolobii TaxID=390850 RepID=A0ACB1AEE9_MELEN